MEGSVTSNQRQKPMEAKNEYPQGYFQTINNFKYSTVLEIECLLLLVLTD